MAMENLISLQSSGLRTIGEPAAPRPVGVQQGSVLVVLDVNKGVTPGALYWALANVVRKGDNLKILGIITHIGNAMGFMVRVEQSTRNSPNIMELQFEIATKKEAIWRTANVKEWCQKAGVKVEVDVKAGNNPKVIAIDEAKSIGAFHVVLDKHMKKDRKYFVDNLSCFVSRFTSSGGVDTIRSFAMNSNKLPPMAPTTPRGPSSQAPGHQSKSSIGSNASYRGASSMSSTSFELGGESGDDMEGDQLSAPSTGDSIDPMIPLQPTVRAAPPELSHTKLYNLLRGPVLDANDNGFNAVNLNNPLRKGPAIRKWLNDDEGRINMADLGLRGRQRFHHHSMGSNGWIAKLNVAPELAGQKSMGRISLTATLRTQATFNIKRGGRQYPVRPEKITMDMHWPLMHWADCRAMRLRSSHGTASSSSTLLSGSNTSMTSFRSGVRRRAPVSGLNYSDMVDSD